jgi:hypothetical protein
MFAHDKWIAVKISTPIILTVSSVHQANAWKVGYLKGAISSAYSVHKIVLLKQALPLSFAAILHILLYSSRFPHTYCVIILCRPTCTVSYTASEARVVCSQEAVSVFVLLRCSASRG